MNTTQLLLLGERTGQVKEFDGVTWNSRVTKSATGAPYKMKRFDGSTWHILPA